MILARLPITKWDLLRAQVVAGAKSPEDAIEELRDQHLAGRLSLATYEERVGILLRKGTGT